MNLGPILLFSQQIKKVYYEIVIYSYESLRKKIPISRKLVLGKTMNHFCTCISFFLICFHFSYHLLNSFHLKEIHGKYRNYKYYPEFVKWSLKINQRNFEFSLNRKSETGSVFRFED